MAARTKKPKRDNCCLRDNAAGGELKVYSTINGVRMVTITAAHYRDLIDARQALRCGQCPQNGRASMALH